MSPSAPPVPPPAAVAAPAPPAGAAAPAESAGVLRAARVVSLGTLGSRALGLLRDATLASLLGAGAAADAFAIAFRIPNLFREALGEGALTAAFLPAYARRRAEGGPAAAAALFRTVLTLLVLVLGAASAAGALLLATLPAAAFAPEDPAKTELILRLAAWCLPYATLVCGAALCAAALQAEGRFAAAAFAPAAMNAAWIAATWALRPLFADDPGGRARAVATGVLVGGVVQAAVALPGLARLGLLPRPSFAFADPALRAMLARMGPVVLGLAPVQVHLFVNALVAESLVPGDGANGTLWYAGRLLQLPLALVGVSLGVAAFPVFSRMAAEGRRGDLGRAAAASLRTMLLLAVPAAAGLAVLAEPLALALFRRGLFSAGDAAAVAEVLRWALLGLPAYCGLQGITRLFHALGDTATPVRVGAWSVAAGFALNLALVGPLGAGGLSLATALGAWGNFAVLAWIARHRHRVRGLRTVPPAAARAAAWTAPCAAAAAGAAALVAGLLPGGGNGAAAAAVAAGVVAGAAAFAGAALLFRDPEALALRAALLRRRGG